MRDAHAHLVKQGLNDSHFDAVVENLGATLKELGVADALIQEAAAIAESTRKDVLGR
jgi:hemoglobin